MFRTGSRPAEPSVESLRLGGGVALTVDVEEWYHNCWAPEYVHPARRPALPEELDRLLPQLLETLDRQGARATFFVLGEVAQRLPRRVREILGAGHEVASHGELHRRVDETTVACFGRELAAAKARLEDLIGTEVVGYRAPEWSLRRLSNPRLRAVAEVGFTYDSSLTAAFGAGSASNPRSPIRCRWGDGLELLELPPFVWGGGLALPAGGWCGRLAPPARLSGEVREAAAAGRMPVLVVHPWELVDRGCPGLLTGLARFFHDAGRFGFGQRFERLLATLPATLPLSASLADARACLDAEEPEERAGARVALQAAVATE